MLIQDLFEDDPTRPIPPVVYFHEQSPEELSREVREYIITGGYPAGDPRAIEDGIHEQFVRLLSAIQRELVKPGGPELPACWISGFYGSGKSSFAKLLGLSLDGHKLPDGRTLGDALLAQDHSPASGDLRLAWHKLTAGRQLVGVVFDIGSNARDEDQIHTVVVRMVQKRLGYSSTSQLVADHELKLELEGLYDRFLEKVQAVHGKPWSALKDSQLADDYFSAALHALQPDLYKDQMAWMDCRTGSSYEGKRSAAEAVLAVQQMLDLRAPGRTLFIVVDEVSQYVHDNEDRMGALQGFVEALGQRLRGRGWLLATGQQQLEQGIGQQHPIQKLKDRFPPALRVYLGVANIRDVVHKRLLRKKKLVEAELRDLFEQHRTDLSLYAYKGDQIGQGDFVEVYPMLPGHVQLLLDITTGLRGSSRVQGDSQAIRGLLQLLGDLFREHELGRRDLGQLLTLDMAYDVLHSALNPDVQMTLARAFDFCRRQEDRLMERVVKAVALLELVQDHQKTDTELIARSLYARLGDPNNRDAVQRALDALRGESLLGYSEKAGYKIESSAGQEWQRERDGYVPSIDAVAEQIQKSLDTLMSAAEKVELSGMDVPWLVLFTDNVGSRERHLRDPRKPTVITLDLQFTKGTGAEVWVPRSDTPPHRDRVIWVFGDVDGPKHVAERIVRSLRMIDRYGHRESSLRDEESRLLIEERNRCDGAQQELREELEAALLSGELFFRGRQTSPREHGTTFLQALGGFGQRVVGELYPHPVTFALTNKDVVFLFDNTDLNGPPPVLCQDRLGILSLDAGRYEVSCHGRVPTDVLAYVKEQADGVSGSSLLAYFGGPPYGIAPDVLRAAVVGLLRGGKVRVQLEGIGELTSVRDEGARELLSDGGFKKARLLENAKATLLPRDRTTICQLFKDCLNVDVARDNDAIADAVMQRFAGVRERLNAVGERFRKLPKETAYPKALTELERALESCRRDRKVEPTVLAVKRALPQLRDGLGMLRRIQTDLTDESIELLREADSVARFVWPSLKELGPTEEAKKAAAALEAHLTTERPWEDTRDLEGPLEVVREEYRGRRRAILEHHAAELEALVDGLKRREGFERLSPDDKYSVTRHLREGAAANTDERAIAPALESLAELLAARRRSGEQKALMQLDALLEAEGHSVVEVALDLSGREIRNEAELDRALGTVRERVLAELETHSRVRLR
jgi:hypothetical protein